MLVDVVALHLLLVLGDERVDGVIIFTKDDLVKLKLPNLFLQLLLGKADRDNVLS